MKKSYSVLMIFFGIVLGDLTQLFILDPIWERNNRNKFLDLPEEFNQIQPGDSVDMYSINDTMYIRFIPKNTTPHNKTIVKI